LSSGSHPRKNLLGLMASPCAFSSFTKIFRRNICTWRLLS
jgi:hypothetical protein